MGPGGGDMPPFANIIFAAETAAAGRAEPPIAPTSQEDFLLYWGTIALFLSCNGRRMHGPTWDPGRLDNFTRGLAVHSSRRLHKVPVAVARLRHDHPQPGRWTLYEPTGSDGWTRAADGEDPLALLELLAGSE